MKKINTVCFVICYQIILTFIAVGKHRLSVCHKTPQIHAALCSIICCRHWPTFSALWLAVCIHREEHPFWDFLFIIKKHNVSFSIIISISSHVSVHSALYSALFWFTCLSFNLWDFAFVVELDPLLHSPIRNIELLKILTDSDSIVVTGKKH